MLLLFNKMEGFLVRRKPSMFSRNYRNQLRKRRIRYATVISVIVILILIGLFSGKIMGGVSNIKASLTTLFSKETINDKAKTENIEENNINENSSDTNVEVKPIVEDEQISLTLSETENINIIYKINNNKKEIKEVKRSGNISYNIAPSKEIVVVLNNATQDMYIADLNKNLTNVSKTEYISTKKEVFKKETVMKQFKNYVWAERPTFIDDTHIAYCSNLPWINDSGTKYLWIIDTTTGQHKSNTKIKGNNFEFADVSAKGLMIIIDGTTMYIDNNGNVVM